MTSRFTAFFLPATLFFGALSAQAASPRELVLYNGKALPGVQVAALGFNQPKQVLSGDAATVQGPADTPDGMVAVRVSGKSGERDALTLQWNKAWYGSLHLDADTPLDLRPYTAGGTLEFDIKVNDLAKGGIYLSMRCGAECNRKVPYTMPARALEGKGWQRLAFSMACFVRKGDDFSKVSLPFALDGTMAGEVAVANVKLVKHGKPNARCPDYRSESVTPSPLNHPWALDWWMPRHEAKLKEVAELKAAGKQPQVVFIGDSITEGWEKSGKPVWKQYYEKYNDVALGFGGDHTENVLWRLQHGEVDGLAPKVAVLMIGTNNTGDREEDPATTAAGIKRLIAELRQRLPNAKILLLAVFPRDEQPTSFQRRINERVNELIAHYADEHHVFFLNINAGMLHPDGTLRTDLLPDRLHPNEQGYEIWAKSMEPTLQKLLAE